MLELWQSILPDRGVHGHTLNMATVVLSQIVNAVRVADVKPRDHCLDKR